MPRHKQGKWQPCGKFYAHRPAAIYFGGVVGGVNIQFTKSRSVVAVMIGLARQVL
jgi:hypothetical protein